MLRAQSEAHLSALVQHSTDVILVITSDTTVKYASPSIREILGYEARDFVGEQLLGYVAEADQALFQPALMVLLTLASETTQAFEFRIRHSDGRLLHTECLITNLLDKAAVGGIVVNLRDITERKQFEEQLTYQAFHDPVTDLANRALFRDRVEHALSRRRDEQQDARGAVPGPRRLQGRQRHLRPRREATAAAGRLLAPALSAARRVTPWRAWAATSSRSCSRTSRSETAVSEIVEGLLEVIGAPLSIDEREVSVQCSIGIAIAGSTSEIGTRRAGRRAAAQRRRRHVPGEGRRR